MNVGIFIKEVDPQSGGAYTFQSEILQALYELSGRSEHSFVIFFSGKGKNFPLDLTGRKISFVPLHNNLYRKVLSKFGATSLGQDVQSLLGTSISGISPKLIRKYAIEFFWFPTSYFFGVVDVPYITTVWDLQYRLQPWFPEVSADGEWIFREKSNQSVLQRATYIIAGTNAGKEEIVRFYGIPPKRIRLLPHPTPSFSSMNGETEDSTILAKLRITPGFLFYPAQFWPHKNHHVLIKALEYLKKNSQVRINLVLTGSDKGNGPYIRQLSEKAGVQDQIYMPGFVTQQDLQSLYQNALALVYPTFCGPENLPPLEAFALGCPVIASRVSGADEQLGDAALLFDPSDHVELAKMIKLLIDKKEVGARLIKRGKVRAGKWTSKDFVSGIFSLLDEFEPIRKSWPAPR